MTAGGALAGLRVLDLAGERGVYCTKILASLGADVLRVEPAGGDPTRRLGPFLDPGRPDPDQSLFHWYYNVNKRAVRIDLDSPAGQARLADLAAEADVLVETFQPGYLAARGLDEAALRARNPRLIVAALTGFGQTGPHRDYHAPDLVAWAMSGVMNLTGEPGQPPLRAAWNQANQIGSLFTLIGTLAALRERRLSGLGQAVDVSAQEAAGATAESTPLFWFFLGQSVTRSGSAHPLAAPFRIHDCADGYALVPAVSRQQWQALIDWLARDGITDHLADEKYFDIFNRITDRQSIEGLIQEWVGRYTARQVFEIGQSLGLATAPISSPAGAAANEQLRAREFFVAVDHPELGRRIEYPGAPFRLAGGSRADQARAPLTAEVAADANWLPRTSDRRAPETGAPADTSAGPLAGVLVLDLTWIVAGPFATWILAELGATVVKLEAREVGDPMRALPPFPPEYPRSLNSSGSFSFLNHNKRNLTIDIKNPAGLDLVRQIAARADVVIDNFSAGTMDRIGLGPVTLSALNPRLIQVSMSGFGQAGPYRDFISFHPTLAALSGLSYLTAYADGQPLGFNNSYMDFLGGIHAVAATLAAIEQRAETGRGQFVDLAQFEAGGALIGPAILEALATGRDPRPTGNALPERPGGPHNAYPAAGDDRWIAIAVEDDTQWQALRKVMGDPAWAADPGLAAGADRAARLAEVDARIAEWTRGFDPHDLMDRLQAAGVPAGVVQNGADLLERDAHLRARGYYQTLDHPEIGRVLAQRGPILFSRTPVPFRNRAPLLGEYNEALLVEILGLTQDQIDELLLTEVI